MEPLEVAEVPSAAAYLDAGTMQARFGEAARRLAARPEIDTILFCGVATAGFARALQPEFTVPLIDGIAAAVAHATALVRLGLRPRSHAASPAARDPAIGLSSPLQRLLWGTPPEHS